MHLVHGNNLKIWYPGFLSRSWHLSNRSLKARIQTIDHEVVCSDNFDISYGTAQGSCLGPLLFIIFTNDIYLLLTFSKIILFADDTTLINSCMNVHFLKYSLKHDMTVLTDWYCANQLSLNVNKTVLIKFWPDLKPFTVIIGDIELRNSSSTRFLGVTVDECLTWNAHVGNLCSKIRANKMLLVHAKLLLPTDALKKIYFAHIYTHLTYSLVVWGSMINKSSYNSLYKLQKECVKLMANVPKSSCVEPIFDQLNLIRLSDLIGNELKKLGFKVTHELLPVPLIELFQINGGKKKHCYETCQKGIPNIQNHSTFLFNKSFLCKCLSLYSKLPNSIRQKSSLKGFCQTIRQMRSSQTRHNNNMPVIMSQSIN